MMQLSPDKAAAAALTAYEEDRQRRLASSVRNAAAAVAATVVIYGLGEVVAEGVLPTSLLFQSSLAVIALLAVLLVRRNWNAERIALAADMATSFALAARLLQPGVTVSGTALILSLKMIAPAMLLPWRLRTQYVSVGFALLVYGSMFAVRAALVAEPAALVHQFGGPLIAALLSVAGAATISRARRDLFLRSAELAASEDRFRRLATVAPVGIFHADAAGNCSYVNERWCQLAGLTPAQATGAGWARALHADDRERVFQEWHAATRDGHEFGDQYRFQTPQGNVRWLAGRAAPLRDERAAITGYVGTITDITELKRAEEVQAALLEELATANHAKSDFVASMSHELRTPLNIMIGYNGLLLDGVLGELTAEQADALHRAQRSAVELLELISTTLDLSRLEAGAIPVAREPVDVEALVAALATEAREAWTKPGVDLVFEVAAKLPQVNTDPAKLKVVLRNLIGNAVKFTERGCVTVNVERVDGGVTFAVADTGIGIAPEQHAAIFDPFRQADGGIATRYGGAGLGLHIVSRMLDLLGGTIAVESEIGHGSTFRAWIPKGKAA